MARKSPTPPRTDWHRLFGLLLKDYFTGSPFVVETEQDLSIHKQLLDVVLLRKSQGQLREPLPDGLEELAAHNLISFKSHHEPLEDRMLRELSGYFENYLKQQRERGSPPLPEDQCHMYAVCCTLTTRLAKAAYLKHKRPGVYDCRRGEDHIRVIVARELPNTANNAPLHLFSASEEKVEYGATHYKLRSENASTVLGQLFKGYVVEGLTMSITLEEFAKQWVVENVDEVLGYIPPEKRVTGLSPEQRVEGLTTEDLERLLEQRRAMEAKAAQTKESAKPRGRAKRKPQ